MSSDAPACRVPTQIDAERPCGLRAACHVLPPALAAAPPRVARLGVPIALEKRAEAIVAPPGALHSAKWFAPRGWETSCSIICAALRCAIPVTQPVRC